MVTLNEIEFELYSCYSHVPTGTAAARTAAGHGRALMRLSAGCITRVTPCFYIGLHRGKRPRCRSADSSCIPGFHRHNYMGLDAGLAGACKRNAVTGYGNHCSHQPGSRSRKRIALPAACPTGVPQTAGSAVCRPADAASGCGVLACVDRRIAGRAHGTAAGGYARRGWKDRAQLSRMPAPVAAS